MMLLKGLALAAALLPAVLASPTGADIKATTDGAVEGQIWPPPVWKKSTADTADIPHYWPPIVAKDLQGLNPPPSWCLDTFHHCTCGFKCADSCDVLHDQGPLCLPGPLSTPNDPSDVFLTSPPPGTIIPVVSTRDLKATEQESACSSTCYSLIDECTAEYHDANCAAQVCVNELACIDCCTTKKRSVEEIAPVKAAEGDCDQCAKNINDCIARGGEGAMCADSNCGSPLCGSCCNASKRSEVISFPVVPAEKSAEADCNNCRYALAYCDLAPQNQDKPGCIQSTCNNVDWCGNGQSCCHSLGVTKRSGIEANVTEPSPVTLPPKCDKCVDEIEKCMKELNSNECAPFLCDNSSDCEGCCDAPPVVTRAVAQSEDDGFDCTNCYSVVNGCVQSGNSLSYCSGAVCSDTALCGYPGACTAMCLPTV
ncbi:hypothetical protein BT63DRAFT_452774 [Microthyrium microscopicum]|uniref:Uncharacterized protein n=1 Tax=Microthyrium microscopicum TaxID=703497 RepID=A0A6A6UL90_9PEZI|nr:hypothetical protein BT63DRAFT_452774 [Microthyrium microscopicum]